MGLGPIGNYSIKAVFAVWRASIGIVVEPRAEGEDVRWKQEKPRERSSSAKGSKNLVYCS